MKLKTFITSIIFLGFFSCKTDKKTNISKDAKVEIPFSNEIDKEDVSIKTKDISEIEKVNQQDSVEIFTVDDYLFNNEMFRENYGQKISGQLESFGKVWFTNDTLNQTLVFELYTDYHRLTTFHFDNKKIPIGLINRMELHNAEGELATQEQKVEHFYGFIEQSIKTGQSKFKSIKGVSIGMHRKKAIELYGNPKNQEISDEFEILYWEFKGDFFNHSKNKTIGNRVAKDSYGHSVTMFFEGDKLVAQILYNDIP